jgi:hypothetical protein
VFWFAPPRKTISVRVKVWFVPLPGVALPLPLV